VPIPQPVGQLQHQLNIETQITKDENQGTYETNKRNKRIIKPAITQYNY